MRRFRKTGATRMIYFKQFITAVFIFICTMMLSIVW